MTDCPRCAVRGQTWNGDPSKCAFPSGLFRADNWNCATMNAPREMLTEKEHYDEDQWSGLIPIRGTGKFIVLGWYKSRGRTEFARVLDGQKLRTLTLELAELALAPRTPSVL